MKKIYMLLLVAALVCPKAYSAPTTIVRQTKGQGVTREQAIYSALYQAVAQAKGIAVSSGRYNLGFQSTGMGFDTQDTRKSIEIDSVSVQTDGSTRLTDIAGWVKSYEVIDEQKIDDRTYEVTIKAWVYDYEDPEQTNRLKLAVMPIQTLYDSYRFGNYVPSGVEMSLKLSQQLSAGITQTNKFAVLDREYIDEFAQNRNILISDDSPIEEKARLGQVLGADYMIVGTISNAGLKIKERSSRAIGRAIREYEVDYVFDYRLIVAPTRQVKLADTVNIALEEDQVRVLVKRWRPEDLDYREMVDNLTARVAKQVIDSIIDRLYPIRIASKNITGQLIINQGGKRISKGSVLDVYVQGEEIIDVDTKESLGLTESHIATIKIEKVTPTISYARLVKGDLDKISVGLICRLKKAELEMSERAKSSIKRTPQGGVKLPFD
ncbi:MAG: CsgG/HfaB family protein [Planctomycetota bacterium]|jgi:curli biogenesis system outer membrane secretion channel CsgG